MQKHYFRIEYTVRVLIGPADIRFELWFDDQKLSRDESIKVDWIPTQGPQNTFAYGTPVETPTNGPFELSNVPQTPIQSNPNKYWINGETTRTGRLGGAVGDKEAAGVEDKRKGRMSGLLAKARGGKWSMRV